MKNKIFIPPFIIIIVITTFLFCSSEKQTYETREQLTEALAQSFDGRDTGEFMKLLHPEVMKKLTSSQKKLMDKIIPEMMKNSLPDTYQTSYSEYIESEIADSSMSAETNFPVKPTHVMTLTSADEMRIFFLVKEKDHWYLTLMVPDQKEAEMILKVMEQEEE